MDDVTLTSYAAIWLTRCEKTLKRRTVETYAWNLRVHILPALGPDAPLRLLTRTGIRDAMRAKLDSGFHPGTVRLMLTVLRTMLSAARFDDELIDENVAERIGRLLPRRKGPQADKAMGRPALAAFLAAAQTTHPAMAALFVVAARAGLRVGELLGLRWDDVDLTGRSILVQRTLDWRRRANSPKGGEAENVPLSRHAADALGSLRGMDVGASPWVFHGPSGQPWSRTHVRRVMHRACAAAGIRLASIHDLRHSFITHLAADGVDSWTLRDLARHKSIVTTEKYISLGRRHRELVDRLDRAS